MTGRTYFSISSTACVSLASRAFAKILFVIILMKMLATHRRKQMAGRLKAGAAYQNSDLVFATSEGTPHNSRNLAQRQFLAILKKLNCQ
jgi:hypothetical protein